MLFRYEKIYDLMCSVLSRLNADFVEHGKRVAFLMLKYSKAQLADANVVYRRVFNALFHDIGAYKVEKKERENIMRFDATHTYAHALEGYLFLKYFSPVGKNAEPVLYHHAFWHQRENYPSEAFREGNLLHLFDRYDVLKLAGNPKDEIRAKIISAEGAFEPESVKRFFELLDREPIERQLYDLSYRTELEAYFSTAVIPTEDFENYLRMLSFTFEVHNYSTLFHSNMTASVGYALSGYLGIDSENRNKIFVAGLVHDLGKIMTPLAILDKPSALSADEMLVMKKHVVYTKELIADYFDPQTVRNASRHHEKLNGTGYPDGLFGDELNPCERILCVADIISALYTKRSYKEAFDTDLVVKILTEMAERNEVDPTVVRAFTEHIPEILQFIVQENDKIKKRYDNASKEYETLKTRTLGQ